ncbi:2772_t:CDS:1, partial [Racocetra persica]
AKDKGIVLAEDYNKVVDEQKNTKAELDTEMTLLSPIPFPFNSKFRVCRIYFPVHYEFGTEVL